MGSGIRRVQARQVFDSRGRPTVEAELTLDDGTCGRAIVPSGASTGQHEAHELRDGDPAAYGGLGVLHAVANVNVHIAPAVLGLDAADQASLDRRVRDLDGTPTLSRLGANAVLAVSMAAARAAAASSRQPLYRYLSGLAGANPPVLPLPMVNILSGGAHARGGMDVQDFLAVAVGAGALDQALLWTSAVRSAAAILLVDEGRSVLLADEGGFAPGYATATEALELMVRAIRQAGLEPGRDVAIAVDVAASQLVRADGQYELRREGGVLSSMAMLERVRSWLDRYPIVSLEDPLGEDDWAGWQALTEAIGERCQLVGDDLFCTNPDRIRRGIAERTANAVLIKLNQIGTVTDTLSAVRLAHAAGYRAIVSARSGETEDPFIADLAVATACGQIKIGSLRSSERMAKYNQLVRIQEDLGSGALASTGAELQRFLNR